MRRIHNNIQLLAEQQISNTVGCTVGCSTAAWAVSCKLLMSFVTSCRLQPAPAPAMAAEFYDFQQHASLEAMQYPLACCNCFIYCCRGIAGTSICLMFTLGEFVLAGLAFALPHWRNLTLAAGLITSAGLLLFPVVPESAR
jgi:hypothetical protein